MYEVISSFKTFPFIKIFLKSLSTSFFLPTLGNRVYQVLFKISFVPVLNYLSHKHFFHHLTGKSHFDFIQELRFRFSKCNTNLYPMFGIIFQLFFIYDGSKLHYFRHNWGFDSSFFTIWLKQFIFIKIYPKFIQEILLIFCLLGCSSFLIYKNLVFFSTSPFFDFSSSFFALSNSIFIFSRSFFILNSIRFYIEEFLFCSWFSFFEFCSFFINSLTSFSLLEHVFYFNSSKEHFCLINQFSLNQYKRDLKFFVSCLKETVSLSQFFLKLNFIILTWLFYNFEFISFSISYSLDKLLLFLIKKFSKAFGFWDSLFFYFVDLQNFSLVFILIFLNLNYYFLLRHCFFNKSILYSSVFFFTFDLLAFKKIKKFYSQSIRQNVMFCVF